MKPKENLRPIVCFFIVTFFVHFTSSAQTSSQLYHDLLKLKETKRVLYVAAHPDDENTRLIAYLANKEHAEVAYLSLTRGDGGQNLIGKELGIELGMIRTQELIRARETDGGRQFFSRAIDFGFSKHPDETLNNWDKEKLLSDVIWIIRKFQPDIIINRFNHIPGTTHGHHTTSAILSTEAFGLAGDPSVFPDQLKWVSTWSPKRIFWNAYSWGGQYEPEEGKSFHRFEVGGTNALLGTTYSQIAADSRTMHKSQGFGATAQIGASDDFMELVKGDDFTHSPFDGVANRWTTIQEGAQVEALIQEIADEFDFREPQKNVEKLLALQEKMAQLGNDHPWVLEKKEALEQLIWGCLGLQWEFVANKELSFPSDDISARLVINNPSSVPLQVDGFTFLNKEYDLNKKAVANQPIVETVPFRVPADFPISQPYWLQESPKDNLFTIEERTDIGPPFNDPALVAEVNLRLGQRSVTLNVPLIYKYNDQVEGEIRQPFTVMPEASIDISKTNVFILGQGTADLVVEVSFMRDILDGRISLDGVAPQGFEVVNRQVDEERKRIRFTLKLHPAGGAEKERIGVRYTTRDGKEFTTGKRRINYKHIPNLTYFPPAEFNLIQLDLQMTPQRIGYIPGAGDDVPEVLSQLGYTVEMIDQGNISSERLRAYHTVILGIRALNVNQSLADNFAKVLQYVENGGNLIIQYNTSSPLLTRTLGPFSISLSRDRVAVEDSPVRADYQAHPVMHSPNRIVPSDFDGWVQERGLYFAGNWDERYVAPLDMNDPGENSSRGSLLLANYGKGTFAYSGISWFRQLPAGVPGAIKLFVNLIEQGGEQ